MATHRNGKHQPKHLAPRHSKTARALGPALAPASLALGAVILAPTAAAAEAPTAHVPDLGAVTAASTLSTGSEALAPRALDALSTLTTLDAPMDDGTPAEPEPSTPEPDPITPEPTPIDPTPGDPTPVDPTPEPEQPTDPVEPINPVDPVDPVGPDTPEQPSNPGGNDGGDPVTPDQPSQPLQPGTPVTPDTTPIISVDEEQYVVGDPAPAGNTWVVADQTAPGTYRAIASYQPGARLAQTGPASALALLAAASTLTGAGLRARSRRHAR